MAAIIIMATLSRGCDSPEVLILYNVTTLDFDESGILSRKNDMVVKIQSDKIDTVYTNNTTTLGQENNSINLEGHYLIPGLIDSHVHLALRDNQNEVENCEELNELLIKYLQAGITSVIDLGISEEIENCLKASSESPNVITAGKMYFEPNKDNSLCSTSYITCPSSIQEAKDDVLRSFERGRKIIKIWNIEPKSEIRNALIEQARILDMLVVEHQTSLFRRVEIFNEIDIQKPDIFAHTPPEILHPPPIFSNIGDYQKYSNILDSMKERNIGLISTIIMGETLEKQKNGLQILEMAEDKEVLFALGTDSGYGESHSSALHKEYDIIANSLDWTTALKAATFDSAKLFKMESNLGNIRQGKNADLIVLDNLPTNLNNLGSICKVIKSGKVVYKSHDCIHN